jgi:uncharacterized membrane protein YphA (DoxX/SURF4 family)
MKMNPQSKTRRIIAWILTSLITLLFVFSAIMKLLAAAQVVEVFTKWGLRDRLVLIGIGELVSALLFLVPRTNSLGVLLLSAYMGGAIVTHMQHAEPFYGQSVLLLLIWVAGYLRHPELLQSFRSASD